LAWQTIQLNLPSKNSTELFEIPVLFENRPFKNTEMFHHGKRPLNRHLTADKHSNKDEK
jgi:hypothetical protein